jgi:diadenosine tetraphosphate (Ap4A) HIT family hydrolase
VTCVFCSIVAGREPACVVFRDDRVMAFLDLTPINFGHTLVIPLRHADTLDDLDPTSYTRVFEVGRDIAAALRRSPLRADGILMTLVDGEAAGQDVFHPHLHVVPRFPGDGFRVDVAWVDPPPPRTLLDEHAAMLRTAFES